MTEKLRALALAAKNATCFDDLQPAIDAMDAMTTPDAVLALLDEIDKLKAENAVMREDAKRWQHASNLDALMTYCPTCCEGFTEKSEMSRDETIFECGKTAGRSKAKQEIGQLRAENSGLRKDAERYQWLCGFSSVTMPELTWGRRAGIPKNKLDAAIDAAAKEPT
jgi:hypothetical protein